MSKKSTVVSGRVSQAQRREATREALLEATIESLVELGYGATTARGVSERAGVSQGAQQYHFPSKAELVHAAMLRLMNKLMADVVSVPFHGTDERAQIEALMDHLWEIHILPVGRAVFELFGAARSDADIAAQVVPIQVQAIEVIRMAARSLVPILAATPGFMDWLLVALSTMRGTALITVIPGAQDGVASWPQVRRHLLRSLDAVIEDADTTTQHVFG